MRFSTGLVLFFFVSFQLSQAQESEDIVSSKWSFELQLGVSKISTENSTGFSFYDDKKSKVSPLVGVFAEYKLGRTFSLIGGLEFEKAEYNYTNFSEDDFSDPPGPTLQTSHTVKYSFLKTKILARLYLATGEKSSFYIQAGPYFSPFIEGENLIEYTQPMNRPDEALSIDNLQDVDFGASLSVGLLVSLVEKHLLNFNLGMDHGFDQNYADSQSDYRFVTYRATVGYKYQL